MENKDILEPEPDSEWKRHGTIVFVGSEKFLDFNREWELACYNIFRLGGKNKWH